MSINRIRSWLYAIAKYSGDVEAITSTRKGAITRRVGRRIAGKATGRALGKLFG